MLAEHSHFQLYTVSAAVPQTANVTRPPLTERCSAEQKRAQGTSSALHESLAANFCAGPELQRIELVSTDQLRVPSKWEESLQCKIIFVRGMCVCCGYIDNFLASSDCERW